MWKEIAATGPLKTTDPPATQPVTEEELAAIFDRLDAARDIFRQNRDLREVLSRLETETRKLRTRNAELEEVLRKFAPMLLDVATTMGLAAKNEEPDTSSQP
jgi:ABC-type transporter Mla subunit MlaD